MLGHMVGRCHFHFSEVTEEWQACAHNHHLYCYSSVALPLFFFFQILSALARLLASVTEISGCGCETQALQVAE